MPSPTLLDVAQRSKPVAKKWIAKATENSHGQFRRKAEAAGMSTRAYADKEKNAGGRLGKQANLALNLMGASGARGTKQHRRSVLYDHTSRRS